MAFFDGFLTLSAFTGSVAPYTLICEVLDPRMVSFFLKLLDGEIVRHELLWTRQILGSKLWGSRHVSDDKWRVSHKTIIHMVSI